MQRDKRYGDAVTFYFTMTTDSIHSTDDLQEIGGTQFTFLLHFVQVGSRKLFKLSLHAAADILYNADSLDDAIRVAISGKCWNKAQELSKKESTPPDSNIATAGLLSTSTLAAVVTAESSKVASFKTESEDTVIFK